VVNSKNIANMGLYDNIKAENSQYVPQFIGSNYEEISKGAAVLDKRYRDNKDYADKIAMLAAQDQYREKDKALKDKMTQSIYGDIDKIAGSEGNFENSSAAVSQIAKGYFTNQERLAAVENFKLTEKDKELEMQGYGLNFGDNREDFTTIDPLTQQPRRFNVNRQKQYDYDKKMQEILGKVNPDAGVTGPTGEKITFDEQERNLIKSGQWQRISPQKLTRLVDALLPNYKQSQEGLQDLQKMTKLDGFSNDVFSIKDAKGVRQTTAVDENMRQRFMALAMPQAFNANHQRWDDYGETAAQKAQLQYKNYWTGSAEGSVDTNDSYVAKDHDTTDKEIYKKNEDGTYTYYVNKQGEKVPLAFRSREVGMSASGLTGNPNAEESAKQFTAITVDGAEMERDLGNLHENSTNLSAEDITAVPELKGIKFNNQEDFRAAVANADKNHQKIAPRQKQLTEQQRKNYNDVINASLGSTNIKIPGQEGSINLSTLAGMAGVDPSKVELVADKVSYSSPKSDTPGGFIEARVVVKEAKKEGYPTTVIVPLNEQFTAVASNIDHLYKNSYYAGKDAYSLESPYFPDQLAPDANGNQLGFYTRTVVLPKSQQKAGQSGYRTIVYPVIKRQNSYGGSDIVPFDKPKSISAWEEEMIKMLTPKLDFAVNSGQTISEDDIKNRGITH
jgi:hypothetical protein